MHRSVQKVQISHETVTHLHLPNDGESLPENRDNLLKIKGFKPFFIAGKDFFVILAKTLAIFFFFFFDLLWIRIPILRLFETPESSEM